VRPPGPAEFVIEATGGRRAVRMSGRSDGRSDVVADCHALPLGSGSVRELLVTGVLEHVTTREIEERLLPHWHDLLAPGDTPARTVDWEAAIERYRVGGIDAEDCTRSCSAARARRACCTPRRCCCALARRPRGMHSGPTADDGAARPPWRSSRTARRPALSDAPRLPCVSIVVSTLDRAPYLRRLLGSLGHLITRRSRSWS
jgi:hypothetical protein